MVGILIIIFNQILVDGVAWKSANKLFVNQIIKIPTTSDDLISWMHCREIGRVIARAEGIAQFQFVQFTVVNSAPSGVSGSFDLH